MNKQLYHVIDVLLLTGNCVVDEALLTGESAPQIKEPIDISNPNQLLDLKSLNKISLISGGTKIVASNFDNIEADKSNNNNNNNINNNSNNNIVDSITRPPNNGAVVRVLTTGFHTSQGELLRTILFSTSRVSVNNPEAFVFILILLCFAIVASGYVLYWGLKDETRSQYKLALNCIMIITSVVPPELPMELSLAVNNSMVKLLKQKIFCTEAFRIPFAGAVEVCCFDKINYHNIVYVILKIVIAAVPQMHTGPFVQLDGYFVHLHHVQYQHVIIIIVDIKVMVLMIFMQLLLLLLMVVVLVIVLMFKRRFKLLWIWI
eukprot:135206_1